MANISSLGIEAKNAADLSSDPGVRRLSEIVANLCTEVEMIQRTAHEAIEEAKRAKRAIRR